MKQFVVNEKKLRKRMIDCDIKTINDLSVKSKVSKPTIYDYINGKSPFSDAFMRLCDYLNTSPIELLSEIDEQNGESSNV